jgi:signal transduction histidine kinase
MRRLRVFQSGAFRLALLFALLFAVGATALVAVVNTAVSQFAGRATDAALIDESQLLLGEVRGHDPDFLRQLVLKRQRIMHGRQYLYMLLDPLGHRIAGELPATAARTGWGKISVVEAAKADEPSDGPDTVRTYGARAGDGSFLVVGRDTSDLDELADWLRVVTIWSGLGITTMALSGGLLIGGVFLRRMDRVNRALQRIMDGALDKRIPAIGMGEEFNQLTQNMNLMLDRTQALMEGIRQVSTDIAHDLRTPLGRLRQHLESMRELSGPEAQEGAIDDALTQLDEVLATFHALLRIGQIEGGAGRARFEVVNLSAIMERVHGAYETSAEDTGKNLNSEIAPNLFVNGDRQLLTQLFANLIENALRHAGEGAQISMHLAATDGAIFAIVADNGPGIPAAERGRVVRRFYRLDRSRSTAGSGLGLSLVAAIVELHGAELKLCDNQPGLGVEIHFSPPTANASTYRLPA